MVHLATPGMKLLFTNKHGKVVLNKKTTVAVFASAFSVYILIQACGGLPQ